MKLTSRRKFLNGTKVSGTHRGHRFRGTIVGFYPDFSGDVDKDIYFVDRDGASTLQVRTKEIEGSDEF